MTKQIKVRDRDVRRVLEAYPRVYFACHTRHVRDPQSGDALSAHQASILDHLDEVDGLSMTDLAGHMGVTVATMSLAVDRLERKGYARRGRDPSDGRRVLLRITEAGVRVREAKSVLDPVRIELVLGRLSSGDREAALNGLQLLARAASAHMRASAAERRTSNDEPRTTDAERRTPNDEPRTTNDEPRTTNRERRTTNDERRTSRRKT